MGYDTSGFINWLYETKIPSNSLQDLEGEALKKEMDERKARLRNLIGIDKLYGFNFKQAVTFIEDRIYAEYTISIYEMEILPKLKFRFCIIKPKNPRKDENGYKTVFYCCGHGNGVEEVINEDKPESYQKNFPIKLAKQGYTTITLDYVGFGDVIQESFPSAEHRSCYSQSTTFLMHGFTMLAMRIFQTQKVMEYARTAIQISQIAVHGISGGGMVATFLSAIDDSFTACGISGYTNLFKDSTLSLYHCVDNFIPDLLSIGEASDITALSAPKHLFITSGTNDDIFPVEATKEAARQIKNIYKKLGIQDRIQLEIFQGIHEISCAEVFNWLETVI